MGVVERFSSAREITAQPAAARQVMIRAAKDNLIVTNQVLEILDKTPERSVRRTPVSKGQRGSFVDL